MPFAQVTRNLPRDVIHVGLDEKNGQYRAYRRDGSLYGTYSADLTRDVKKHKRDNTTGGCAPLSIDEAKQRQYFQYFHYLCTPLTDMRMNSYWL